MSDERKKKCGVEGVFRAICRDPDRETFQENRRNCAIQKTIFATIGGVICVAARNLAINMEEPWNGIPWAVVILSGSCAICLVGACISGLANTANQTDFGNYDDDNDLASSGYENESDKCACELAKMMCGLSFFIAAGAVGGGLIFDRQDVILRFAGVAIIPLVVAIKLMPKNTKSALSTNPSEDIETGAVLTGESRHENSTSNEKSGLVFMIFALADGIKNTTLNFGNMVVSCFAYMNCSRKRIKKDDSLIEGPENPKSDASPRKTK